MIETTARPSARRVIRATWAAIIAAEILFVSAATLFALAVSWIDLCIGFGCSSEPEQSGGVVFAVLVLSLVAFLAGPIVAARITGWKHPFGMELLTTISFVGALLLAAGPLDARFNDVGAALVAGLAVLGCLAVRPSAPELFRFRLPLLLGFVVAAVGFTALDIDVVVASLMLLTLPAVAISDTIALRARDDGRPEADLAPTLGTR